MSKPVTPCECGAPCNFYYREGEPCWGQVTVVDEDCYDDPSLNTWVHGCEGHADGYNGPYIPEGSKP